MTSITGVSRGIGESIASAYAQMGAKVMLASCKQTNLDNVARRIGEARGDAFAMAAHTGDAAAIAAVVEKAISTYGVSMWLSTMQQPIHTLVAYRQQKKVTLQHRSRTIDRHAH